jgi:catechol 2,3-dioxygenase-like lactoylglutathione lyase family enzyme
MESNREVMLRTDSLAAAKAYYHGVLGMPVIVDADDVIGFDTGAFALYFEPGDDNGAVFEFEVEDVAAAKARLLAQGCLLVEEDHERPRCYLRDAFGLTFNLTRRHAP